MTEKTVDTIVDQHLEKLAKQYAQTAAGLSDRPLLREAFLKAALAEIIWELYAAFPNDRYELAEALEGWDETVREAIANDRKAKEGQL